MSKIRINDLARELEVKSKAILDVLEAVGVTEKKTHSSSLELDEAERVRQHITGQSQRAAKDGARPARDGDEIKTKIDLSKISKPGDVTRFISQKSAPAAPPVRTAPPIAAKPAAVVSSPRVATPAAAPPLRPTAP